MRKLSELSTDECLSVLCEITPFLSNIVTDEELMSTIGKAGDKKGLTAAGVVMAGVDRITKCVPLLLKTHREDVFQIVARVGGVEPEKVAAQNIMVTLVQIRAILKDKELLDFFKSWQRGEEAE